MQDRITLTEVKQAFDQWRADKTHPREKTPKHLRRQVEAIAPYYPRRQIITLLSITENQMNRYVRNNQEIRTVVPTVNDLPSNEFIELSISEPSKVNHELVSSTALTITRGDGTSWAISKASPDVISESLHLFLQG